MKKMTRRMKMIKITLLQYLYYYDLMSITSEQIEKVTDNTTKIITNGIIDNKACTLIDFEHLEADELYFIL